MVPPWRVTLSWNVAHDSKAPTRYVAVGRFALPVAASAVSRHKLYSIVRVEPQCSHDAAALMRDFRLRPL